MNTLKVIPKAKIRFSEHFTAPSLAVHQSKQSLPRDSAAQLPPAPPWPPGGPACSCRHQTLLTQSEELCRKLLSS